MRAVALIPEIRQGSRADATSAVSGEENRARNPDRVDRGRREVSPAVAEASGWEIGVPAQADIQIELGTNFVIVLEVAREIVELLPDEADGVDLSAICLSQQEGRERVAAGVGIGNARSAGFLIAKADASGFALAAESVVVIQLIHAAELQRVLAVDPGEIVVIGIDGVLRTVVGLAAPGAVVVAGTAGEQIHQILIAVRHIGQAELVLPVADIFLRRFVILTPVVAAGVEVVDLGGAQRPGPTEPDNVAALDQIVVIGIKTGESWRAVRSKGLMFAVVAIVTGDAMLLVEDVIALDAPFVDGVDLGALGLEEVVRDVSGSARSRAVVGRDGSPGLEYAEGFLRRRAEQRLRNDVAGENLPGVSAVSILDLGEGIVDRNRRCRRSDPFTEIAVVHLRSGDRKSGAVGSGAIAETFVGEEEKCLVLAVIDLGNPDRTADGEAEIVLLINRVGDMGGVVEEVIRVEIVIAHELVRRAVELGGAGFGLEVPDAGPVSILCFVAAGIDGELIDGLDRRSIGSDPAFQQGSRGVRGNAVERGAV